MSAKTPTSKRRPGLPLGGALRPTIDRLKEIAARASDALLLADGPPHPDHELLDACGEFLHLMKRADELTEVARHTPFDWRAHAEGRPQRDGWDEAKRLESEATHMLRRVGKRAAKTPAGIYAKALVARSSKTGAAILARSLANDLIACQPLRESLWPAQVQEEV